MQKSDGKICTISETQICTQVGGGEVYAKSAYILKVESAKTRTLPDAYPTTTQGIFKEGQNLGVRIPQLYRIRNLQRLGGGGLKFLLQFLQFFLIQTLYKAKDKELKRAGGGGGLKFLLQFLQFSLVHTFYKAMDTELIRPGGGPGIPSYYSYNYFWYRPYIKQRVGNL